MEDVDHVSDSDTDDKDESGPPGLNSDAFTIGVFPTHQSPIYLHLSTKQEKVKAVNYYAIITLCLLFTFNKINLSFSSLTFYYSNFNRAWRCKTQKNVK